MSLGFVVSCPLCKARIRAMTRLVLSGRFGEHYELCKDKERERLERELAAAAQGRLAL
jgi:hypothetical protein